MNSDEKLKRDFLSFYLDPEILTQEETEEFLREEGVNVEEIKEKGELLVKKLEAKQALRNVGQKKSEFLYDLKEYKENLREEINGDNEGYRMAARKQKGDDLDGETDDAKLLEFLKKKKKL